MSQFRNSSQTPRQKTNNTLTQLYLCCSASSLSLIHSHLLRRSRCWSLHHLACLAHTSGERPFVTAAVVAFMTVLCIESLALTAGPAWARPEVLPPPITMILAIVTISLMTGAMTGVVALGLRSLRGRLRPRQ